MSLYNQLNIDDAIKQHSSLISKLKQHCADHIQKDSQQFDDDIFLVRFCLSHNGDFAKTSSALKEAIDWRVQNKEILEKVANPKTIHPDEEKLRSYAPADLHYDQGGKIQTLKDGSPYLIIRGGLGEPATILKHLGEQTIINGMVFSKERIYQFCDRETRRTRKLIKMISIADGTGASVFRDFSFGFASTVSKASSSVQNHYPQLLGLAVSINFELGAGLKFLLSVATKLMPASVMSKAKFCGGVKKSHDHQQKQKDHGDDDDDLKKCPVASQIIDPETFPSFLPGGKCRCKNNCCIAGFDNDRTEKVRPWEEKEADKEKKKNSAVDDDDDDHNKSDSSSISSPKAE